MPEHFIYEVDGVAVDGYVIYPSVEGSTTQLSITEGGNKIMVRVIFRQKMMFDLMPF